MDGSGSVVSIVTAEVEPLSAFIGGSISVPVVQAGILLSVFGYMFWAEPLMAAVSLALLCPQLWFVPLLQQKINERNRKRTEGLRSLSDRIVDDAESRASRRDQEAYASLIDRIRGLRLAAFRLKFTMKFLVNLLQHLGTVGVLFVGGWLVLEGRTEVGTVVAFLSGTERVGEPWRELVAFFRQLSDARMRYALARDAIDAHG